MRELQKHYDEIKQFNATILSVSVKPPQDAKRLVDLFNLDYPVLYDADTKTIEEYGVLNEAGNNAVISVFIIDKKGIIRWKHISEQAGDITRSDQIIEELQKI